MLNALIVVWRESLEAMLVIGVLLASGIDRMIGLDWLNPPLDPAWDTSAPLDDSRGAGRLMADFLGYRARPSATLLIAYAAFWAFALWRLGRTSATAAR